MWRSTVGKKIVMAVTGLIMVAFVIAHVAGNLLAFDSPAKLNAYGAFLKGTPELLWTERVVLLVAVTLHIVAAVQLTLIEKASRPIQYAKREYQAATFASRTIRWGGVFLAVFIVFHILHMTTGTVHPDFIEGDVYHNMIAGFSVPWVAAFYVVAMIALGLHLYHGAWSSFRTLGITQPSAHPLRRRVVAVVSIAIAALFASIPLAVVTGILR
jgi:succinate dehydrogenase / fumarate reductase, cytochrome b subunit